MALHDRYWVEFADKEGGRIGWVVAAPSEEEAIAMVQRTLGRHLPLGWRVCNLTTEGGWAVPDAVLQALPERPTDDESGLVWLPEGKNIAIFFDGTLGEITATKHGTNALRLFNGLTEKGGPNQVALYVPGVGTLETDHRRTRVGRWIARKLDAIQGRGARRNLKHAYRFLVTCYEPGDRVYLFGFSRGAYTARAFAGFLHAMGLLWRGTDSLLDHALRYYWVNIWKHRFRPYGMEPYVERLRRFRPSMSRPTHVRVEFMGLWDTVGSMGRVARHHRVPDFHLPNVVNAWHAVSIDERRSNSRLRHLPDLTNADTRAWRNTLVMDSASLPQRDPARDCFQTMWFAGTHSDVGGGTSNVGLGAIPLQWMVVGAARHGLLLDPGARSLAAAAHAGRCGAHRHSAHQPKGLWRFAPGRRRDPDEPPGATVHRSVELRRASRQYKPANVGEGARYVTTQDWPSIDPWP